LHAEIIASIPVFGKSVLEKIFIDAFLEHPKNIIVTTKIHLEIIPELSMVVLHIDFSKIIKYLSTVRVLVFGDIR
jgi:hypothetical protein